MPITSNLYPPIIPDAMPAFKRKSTCKIYFALSAYNNAQDIKNVQVSLINQKTNASALNFNKYPSGIKLATLKQDTSVTNDYKYYIEIIPNDDINESDLSTKYFTINQYYIVQLRLTHKRAVAPPSTGTQLATWLFEQRSNFSEWSNICLIKGIETPNILINKLKANSDTVSLSTPLTKIVGKLYYDDSSETQYLKSYHITAYETSKPNNLIFKTEQIYSNQYNPNEFNYEIPYDFDRDVNYTLAFTYTTNNSYSETVNYKFKIAAKYLSALDGVITITLEEDNGRIKFDIDFENTIRSNEDLIIKRASFKTNFKIWETIKTIPHKKSYLRHIWYDNTIESGVLYKYRVQQAGGDQRFIQIDNPVMCVFEDIFLTGGNKQLKIQFNPTIGDLKYNTMDSQQVTLGAKYPYVKRNGNNFFRSFSIGGLISAFMDDNDWYGSYYDNGKFHIENKKETFTSPLEIFKESKDFYSNYNLQNNINQYQDYIYEREFRQKVSDFLYENNVKLFRSLTEGNILIKLQNVSLQPITSLGRMLYSFSATAVEIDDFTGANLNKYNITNKYFYVYKKSTITDSFSSGKSIITDYILNSSDFSKYNTELFKIYKLDIELQQQTNAIVYVKTANDSQYVRHTTVQKALSLDFDNDSPIEDLYFYGIHLNSNQYLLSDEYYYSTNQISNPAGNKVYYIYHKNGEHLIDDYISYNRRIRNLDTYEEQTQRTTEQDYTLLTEGTYIKYIYYNGNYYPFSDNGDVLMKTAAKVTYYYETKEAN